MYEIDGSVGGGQILRSAVSLSALTGEPVRIENVRGDRPKPGLRPQHLAALEAVAGLCGATMDGDEEGSETLVFEPGSVTAADVTVDIGTAGSVSLVLDTVLPLATTLDDSASVTVSGGTDVKWAPPIDYLRQVKLPMLREVGLSADIALDRRGFYPVGGGEATVMLEPSECSRLDAAERGPLRRLEIYSTADERLEDADVAERQAAAAATQSDVDVPTVTKATYADADCAGSALVVVAVYEQIRAGFTALGEAGKPSEEVASEAVASFQTFHAGTAAVDRHMADQLMIYAALSGGEILAPELTDHMETNRGVIETFGYELEAEELSDGVLISA